MGNKNAFLNRIRLEKELYAAQKAHEAALGASGLTQELAIVALNNVFGFGDQRAERFVNELRAVAEEHDRECEEDYELAKEHLRRRLEQILRCKVERVD
jgi:hypothetical protein